MNLYHLAIDGKQSEVFTQIQVRDMIADGEVDKSTIAWTQGMAEWLPLGEFNELEDAFVPKPPRNVRESGPPVRERRVPPALPERRPVLPDQPDQTVEKKLPRTADRRMHPWIRFGARGTDTIILSALSVPIFMLLLPEEARNFEEPYNIQLNLLVLAIHNAFGCLFETILLSTWGTTVGKFLFGVVIRDRDGQKLSFKLALQRTLLVYVKGLALMIALITPIAMMIAHARLVMYGVTTWDRDLRLTVTHRKPKRYGMGLAAAIYLAFAAILYYQATIIQKQNEEIEAKKKEEIEKKKAEESAAGNGDTNPEGTGEQNPDNGTPAPDGDGADSQPSGGSGT